MVEGNLRVVAEYLKTVEANLRMTAEVEHPVAVMETAGNHFYHKTERKEGVQVHAWWLVAHSCSVPGPVKTRI